MFFHATAGERYMNQTVKYLSDEIRSVWCAINAGQFRDTTEQSAGMWDVVLLEAQLLTDPTNTDALLEFSKTNPQTVYSIEFWSGDTHDPQLLSSLQPAWCHAPTGIDEWLEMMWSLIHQARKKSA